MLPLDGLLEVAAEIPNFRIACATNYYSEGPLAHASYIYRSGNIDKISETSKNILSKELAIECHIDLRSCQEIDSQKCSSELKNNWEWKHYPLTEDENVFRILKHPTYQDYYEYYFRLITNNIEKISMILSFIAYSKHQRFLVSCHAGKDRTGIIIMLVMLLLEINTESIIDDYILTEKYLSRHIDYFKNSWEKRGLSKEEYKIRLKPHKKTLILLINRLKKDYGSLPAFFKRAGFNTELITSIKNKFSNFYFNHPMEADSL